MRGWVWNGDRTHSAHVAKLVFLAGKDLSQDAAHDLSTPGLGQVGDDEDGLGRSKGADALADLEDEFLAQGIYVLIRVLQGHKGIDGLARELICHADDSSFAHGVVLDQSRFDLCCGETVTANIYNIINSAPDPVETLVVTTGSVTGEL